MNPNERAADLLIHYFRLVADAAGVPWDSDNDSEVRLIVDSLTDQMQAEIRDHCESEPHIYPDGSRA